MTVDGDVATGALRQSLVNGISEVGGPGGPSAFNTEENCSTTGATAVDAGSRTVALAITDRATAGSSGASVWALLVPFDGTGGRTSAP